jgi:6-pyruvoyltetrahydropterin/6-carboxytetrahydropterin synthase
MNLLRSFKFYAAHRNQHLAEKCASLHGHRYQVDYSVKMMSRRALDEVTVLFADFDKVERRLTDIIDHSTLLDFKDPMRPAFLDIAESDSMAEHWRVVTLPFPTSAENLAVTLYAIMGAMLYRTFPGRVELLNHLILRETDSTRIQVTPSDLVEFPEEAYLILNNGERFYGHEDLRV